MELMPQTQVPNSSPYINAPTSPNAMQFFTAPGTPTKEFSNSFGPESESVKAGDDDLSSNLDDFEFETSKKFGVYVQFEDTECCIVDEKERQGKAKHERGGSLPTMAFADELFCNGQVMMPLKLPPRLQFGNQPHTPSTPRSPISFKVPFVRRPALWNDDFDPFMAALENVREENRGRRSGSAGKHHGRSRSHSPFRSPYSEWCNEEGVRPLENDLGEPNKRDSRGKIENHDKEVVVSDDNKMKGIKGILRRYASIGKDSNEEKSARKWTSSYLKKLSSKFKGNGKKRGIEEPKMTVTRYKRNKPALALCFYGIESPRILR